ncbi:MAG: hypothetical protein LBJ93_00395 [Clostridiales bacterium]|nr:hypothetical protein [Clostridiales bacterium]
MHPDLGYPNFVLETLKQFTTYLRPLPIKLKLKVFLKFLDKINLKPADLHMKDHLGAVEGFESLFMPIPKISREKMLIQYFDEVD